MSIDPVYRQLARRLDAIPNGFPATESGVELELLAKIFRPEEAALAAVLSLDPEPANVIAERVGLEPQVAYQMVKGMVRKGQITFRRQGRQLVFGLMPFVVGIYEEQLPRLDAELAALFERYFQETRGSFVRQRPSIHRVIPVEEAVAAGIQIYPYERATELLKAAKSWGVRECMCRLQQKLVGKGCEHPTENCLFFAPMEGAIEHSESTRSISLDEALRILHEAEMAGLVHSPGNYRDGHMYICNCCTCCCAVLRNIAEFSIPTAIASAAFVAIVDEELCAGCGDCLARCQFEALTLWDDICQVDAGRCVGCGLCVTICPTGALQLVRRPADEIVVPPQDLAEWMARRAQARGLAVATA